MAKRSKLNIQSCAPTHAWQRYQTKLHRQSARERMIKRIPAYIFVLILLFVLMKGFFWALERMPAPSPEASESVSGRSAQVLDPSLLPKILADEPWSEVTKPSFSVTAGIDELQMHTTICPTLQETIQNSIDQKYAKYFGLVAIKPESGEVVAMVSFDKTGRNTNVCTRPDFPAASLFKIITAAAAIEEYGYSAGTRMAYNGRKHTLYKSQLKPENNKYTNHISFEASFANSINPVFGKIGINQLKKSGLEKYSRAFGFNRNIDFDLPLPESPMVIKNEPYHWAEIASGFNKQTLISPLHAAVLVSGIMNNGELMRPILIASAHKEGETIYQSSPRRLNRAISPDTAQKLKRFMHATVSEGTARNAFRGCQRDPVLSRLTIGGKTGSINNNPEHIKYDWFAGFGEEKNGSRRKLVVSVFVAHKEYIGTRAAVYAHRALQAYFEKKQTNSKT